MIPHKIWYLLIQTQLVWTKLNWNLSQAPPMWAGDLCDLSGSVSVFPRNARVNKVSQQKAIASFSCYLKFIAIAPILVYVEDCQSCFGWKFFGWVDVITSLGCISWNRTQHTWLQPFNDWLLLGFLHRFQEVLCIDKLIGIKTDADQASAAFQTELHMFWTPPPKFSLESRIHVANFLQMATAPAS